MKTRMKTNGAKVDAQPTETPAICCSFCGAFAPDTRRLIVGPAVAICNVCVDECNDVILHGHLLELMRIDETRRSDGPGRLMAHLMGRDLPQIRRYLAAVRQVLENSQAALQCANEALSVRSGRTILPPDETWDNLWPSHILAMSNRDLTDQIAILKGAIKRTLELQQTLQRMAQALE